MLSGGHISIKVIGVPLAGLAVVGVGSGSYSEIGGSVPVAAIMAGVETGTAEVGDLIVSETGIAEIGAHAVIHFGTGFVIGRSDAIVLAQVVKRRTFLIGETVGGDMADLQICSGLKVLLLDLGCLAGEAVHEVYADVSDAGIKTDAYCINGLS